MRGRKGSSLKEGMLSALATDYLEAGYYYHIFHFAPAKLPFSVHWLLLSRVAAGRNAQVYT